MVLSVTKGMQSNGIFGVGTALFEIIATQLYEAIIGTNTFVGDAIREKKDGLDGMRFYDAFYFLKCLKNTKRDVGAAPRCKIVDRLDRFRLVLFAHGSDGNVHAGIRGIRDEAYNSATGEDDKDKKDW